MGFVEGSKIVKKLTRVGDGWGLYFSQDVFDFLGAKETDEFLLTFTKYGILVSRKSISKGDKNE